MRILSTFENFVGFAGTETYTLTVAKELERLGHDLLIYSPIPPCVPDRDASGPLARTLMQGPLGELAGLPDFFAGPASRPVEGDERIAARRAVGRLNLEQLLDVETGTSQQGDHLSVGEVELDGVIVRPLEVVHPKIWS
jgi:hypothetical protein